MTDLVREASRIDRWHNLLILNGLPLSLDFRLEWRQNHKNQHHKRKSCGGATPGETLETYREPVGYIDRVVN